MGPYAERRGLTSPFEDGSAELLKAGLGGRHVGDDEAVMAEVSFDGAWLRAMCEVRSRRSRASQCTSS